MPPPPEDGQPLSVLIVDGYADAASSLAELLRLVGHRVAVADCAAAALAVAERQSPDVVVLELRLPGLDGWAVAGLLRERGCRARLIAFTTCGLPEDRRRSREAGIERHFLKAADPHDLLAALADGQARPYAGAVPVSPSSAS